MAGIKIRLVKSLIGSNKKQIATVNALGLRKIGDEIIQPDNPQTNGKIQKVKHLISVVRSKED